MVKIDYEGIKDQIHDWYSIQLTRRQVQKVLNTDEALRGDLKSTNGYMDTSSREWFLDTLGKFIGVDGRWPLGMDSETYTICFFETFKQAARKHNIKLLNGTTWGDDNG